MKRFRESVAEGETSRAFLGENIQLMYCQNIKSTFDNILQPFVSNLVLFKKKLINNKNAGSRKAKLETLEKENTNTKLYMSIKFNIRLHNMHHER